MKNSVSPTTLSWDGTHFVDISQEFLKEERRKIRSMTYEEAADYILFGSAWSVAFRDAGWKRTKSGKVTIYSRTRSKASYSDDFGFASDEMHHEVLVAGNGNASLRAVVTGTVFYDDGRTEEEETFSRIWSGDEAMNRVTEGVWHYLEGK